MSAGMSEPSEVPKAPRVLMSAPWIVVMLGIGLLAGLLVVALLSSRGTERRVIPAAADPPIYLPTRAAENPFGAPTSTARPPATGGATATPTRSPSPSPRASTASPVTRAPSTSEPLLAGGTVTARYEVTGSDRKSFEARLTVVNGSGQPRDWTVKLFFAGNVKSVQASSTSGLAVSTEGGGLFVLGSTGALEPGRSAIVQLRFIRTGTGDTPGQCTINGTDCAIG